MLAILVGLIAAAAAFTWLSTRNERTGRWSAALIRIPRRAPAAAAVCIALLAVGIVALAARDSGHGARSDSGAAAKRLQSFESNRYAYWKVALRDGFGSQPVRGVGAGGFAVEWLRHRTVRERAKVAHSLYVETLAELGLVGFAFLLAFLGGLGVAVAQAARLAPAQSAGPLAALVVWTVHSAVDWDWEMPTVTLFALVLAGALVAASEAGEHVDTASVASLPQPEPAAALAR
jgi:O-antigen ligase